MPESSVKWIAALAFAVACSCAPASADDVRCRISQTAVQKFADAVFPMTIKGNKSLGTGGIGAAVAGSVPWTATISNPRISLARDKRTFEAFAVIEAAGVVWKGPVRGLLVIDYDARRKQLIVRVQDAVVPLDLGLLRAEVDVSSEVPEFAFSVALPEVVVPETRATVEVQATPTLTFEQNAVVVSSDVEFKTRK